jgi:hypothetical protein
LGAAVVGVGYLMKYRRLRVGVEGGRLRFTLIEQQAN